MPDFSRPTLPPLSYALYLPRSGHYLRRIDSERRRCQVTSERHEACALPEPQAVAIGLALVRASGQPVELRA
jgi:hypothetical protein